MLAHQPGPNRAVQRQLPVAALALLFACLYALSLGRGFYTSDGDVMFHTAEALIRRGTFALAPDPTLPQIVPGSDGRFYGKYDPGLPLLIAPLFALGDWLARLNDAHRAGTAALFALAVPALAAALTVPALALVADEIGAGRPAPGIALAAGLATPLWPYARTLFPEAVLALTLTGAVGCVLRAGHADAYRAAWLLAAGAALGVGMLVRAAFAIYAFPLALLALTYPHARGFGAVAGRLLTLAVGAAPFMAALAWHNALRFDDPLRFGYAGEGFTTPLWRGVTGLLFSPGRSVFLYAPPLVLSALLWPRFRRAHPAPATFLFTAWGVAMAFYGTWWAWHGGWSWGPRFLVPLIPLSLLPLTALPLARGWRWAALGLGALGVGVQMLAVLVDVTPHYAALAARGAGFERALFAAEDAPLLAAARRALDGATEPLALFHLGGLGLPVTWTVGLPFLCIVGLLIGAWRVAAWGRH